MPRSQTDHNTAEQLGPASPTLATASWHSPLSSLVIDNPVLRFLLIFLPNLAWFFAGFVQFALRSHRWRGSLSSAARQKIPKIGDQYHQDFLIYLGAMNATLAASVIDAALPDWITKKKDLSMYLRLWGAAHAGQSIVGWSRIKPSGRWDWKRSMGPITYVDTALAIWNWSLIYWKK